MLRVFLNYSEIFTQIFNKNKNICDGVRKEEENYIEDSQKIERFQWHTIYSSGLLHHSSYKTQLVFYKFITFSQFVNIL